LSGYFTRDVEPCRCDPIWLQLNSRDAPSKAPSLEGELAYANGEFSWRARMGMQRGPFTVYGEMLRVDKNSPLISIGAQPGGREKQAFGLKWRANSRVTLPLFFNHTPFTLELRGVRKVMSSFLI
jgi:hypothetical protein